MNGTLSKSQRRRANKKARDSSIARARTDTTTTTVTRSQKENGGTSRRKKRNRKQNSQSSRRGSNPYLECLMNPDIPGGKVPDLTSVPTGTVQLRMDQIITTASDTYGVLLIPHPNASLPYSNSATAGQVDFRATTTWYNWDMSTAIKSIYTSCRPVSASIEVEYIGSSTYDQGYLVAGTIPKQQQVFSGISTVGGFLKYPGSESFPVRNGAKVIWAPQDNADFEFAFTNAGSNVTNYPTIFVVGGGLATGCSLKVSLLLNLEVIAAADTANIVSMEYSPVDTNALNEAFSFLQRVISYSSPIFSEFAGPFIKPTARLLGQTVARRTIGGRNSQYQLTY